MAQPRISKRVVFSGTWQSQTINDQLLQQIGSQNVKKKKKALKGSSSVLNLTDEKMDILIYDKKGKVVRNDQIPLVDIMELTANKYAATCIFAIVRDNINKNYFIFVFHCSNDRDAAEILQGFGRIKQRLTGEGYNTDIKPAGNNWTLQQKEQANEGHPQNGSVTVIETKSTPNGHVRVINTEKEHGEARIVTTTRTVQAPASTARVVVQRPEMQHELQSTTIRTTQTPVATERVVVERPEMENELHNLAEEVREIKMLLGKSQGRQNFEKHYKYLLEPSATTTKHISTTKTHTTATNRHQPQGYRVVVEKKPNDFETSHKAGSVRVVQPAQYVRQYRSKGSTTSSINSGYSKRVYDSPNPALEHTRLYVQQQRPRATSKRYIQTAQPRPRSQDFVYAYPSNVVTKNIEDVYKNRSMRMRVVPQARPQAEYVKFSSPPNSPTIVVNPPEEKVKEYIAENRIVANDQHQVYDPEVRHIYENRDLSNEITVEQVSNVRKSPIIIANQTEISTAVVQNYNEHEINEAGDDVIVIKADRSIYRNTVPVEEHQHSQNRETTIVNNTVYHIKSEGMESFGDEKEGIRYTVVEDAQPHENQEHGLWESYAQEPDVNAGKETIEKEIAYRYHEGEGHFDEFENGEKREEKRVHYMENIEQTIDDLPNGDEDGEASKEIERINGQHFDEGLDEVDDDDYVLNEEELKAFNTEPNLVIIEKEN